MSSPAKTGVVLAGGKSTRMGEDKGLILYKGKPLAMHVIESLAPECAEVILISGNSAYDELSVPRYEDLEPDQGPLGGMLAGLHYSKHDICVMVACDVPHVTGEFIRFVADQIEEYPICVPVHSEQTQQSISVIRKDVKKDLQAEFDSGIRKVLTAFENVGYRAVDVNHFSTDLLKNFNSKSDLI